MDFQSREVFWQNGASRYDINDSKFINSTAWELPRICMRVMRVGSDCDGKCLPSSYFYAVSTSKQRILFVFMFEFHALKPYEIKCLRVNDIQIMSICLL